jgi:hypothetical protein
MALEDDNNGNHNASGNERRKIQFRNRTAANDLEPKTDGSELGIVNPNFHSTYSPAKIGFQDVGSPEELEIKLGEVGYHCLPFYAVQMSLLLNTRVNSVKCILLEGPSGCGKSFMARS